MKYASKSKSKNAFNVKNVNKQSTQKTT